MQQNPFTNYYTSNVIKQYNIAQQIQENIKQTTSTKNWLERGWVTLVDINANVLYGLGKGIEGIVDSVASLAAAVSGNKDIRAWVEKDHFGSFMNWEYLQNVALKDSYTSEWGKIGEWIEGAAQGVGQMLPQVAIGIATGGTSTAAQVVSNAMLFMSAMGKGTEQAWLEGAGNLQGIGYGALVGSVELATERMFGVAQWSSKAFGKGMFDKYLTKYATSNFGRSFIGKIASSFLSEGIEETVSEFVDPLLKFVYKDNKGEFMSREHRQAMLDSFVIGGLTSVALSGITGGITYKSDNLYVKNKFNEANSHVDILQSQKNTDINLKDSRINNVIEFRKQDLDSVSQRLQSMTETKRATFIENNNLGRYFNQDGTVNKAYYDFFDTNQNRSLNTFDKDIENVYDGELNNEQKRIARALDETGRDYVFMKDTDYQAKFQDGVYYFNAENVQDNYTTLATHEIIHSLEQTKAYNKLDTLIKERASQDTEVAKLIEKITEEVKAKYVNEITKAKYNEQGINELIRTETNARVLSELVFKDEGLQLKLLEYSPKAFSKIFNWLNKAIRTFATSFKANKSDLQFMINAEYLFRKAVHQYTGHHTDLLSPNYLYNKDELAEFEKILTDETIDNPLQELTNLHERYVERVIKHIAKLESATETEAQAIYESIKNDSQYSNRKIAEYEINQALTGNKTDSVFLTFTPTFLADLNLNPNLQINTTKAHINRIVNEHGIPYNDLLDVLNSLNKDNVLLVFSTNEAETINIIVDKYKTQSNGETVPMLLAIKYDGGADIATKDIPSNFLKTAFYPENNRYISDTLGNNPVHFLNRQFQYNKKRNANHLHTELGRQIPVLVSGTTFHASNLPQSQIKVKGETRNLKGWRIIENNYGERLTPMQSHFFELADGTKVLDNQGRLLVLTTEQKNIYSDTINFGAELTTDLDVNSNTNHRYYLFITNPIVLYENDIDLKTIRQNIAKQKYTTKGYDGVFYNKLNGETTYIPFYQDQIKYTKSGRPLFIAGQSNYGQYSLKKDVKLTDNQQQLKSFLEKNIPYDLFYEDRVIPEINDTKLVEIYNKYETQINNLDNLTEIERLELINDLANELFNVIEHTQENTNDNVYKTDFISELQNNLDTYLEQVKPIEPLTMTKQDIERLNKYVDEAFDKLDTETTKKNLNNLAHLMVDELILKTLGKDATNQDLQAFKRNKNNREFVKELRAEARQELSRYNVDSVESTKAKLQAYYQKLLQNWRTKYMEQQAKYKAQQRLTAKINQIRRSLDRNLKMAQPTYSQDAQLFLEQLVKANQLITNQGNISSNARKVLKNLLEMVRVTGSDGKEYSIPRIRQIMLDPSEYSSGEMTEIELLIEPIANGDGILTTQEITDLYTFLKMTYHQIKARDTMTWEGKRVNTDEIVEKGIKELSRRSEHRQTAKSKYDRLVSTAYNVFRELSLGDQNTIVHKMYNMIIDGHVKQIAFRQQADNTFKEFRKNNKRWLKKGMFETVTIDGKSITKIELINLYLLWQRHNVDIYGNINYQGRNHILSYEDGSGTLVLLDEKFLRKGMVKEAETHARTIKVDENWINKAFTYLDTTDMEFIKLVAEVMELAGDKKAEVDMYLYGTELPRENNYFPIFTKEEHLKQNLGMVKPNSSFNMSKPSFTHEINPQANTPIYLSNVVTIVENHIHNMSVWYGYKEAIDNVNKLYNKRITYMKDGELVETNLFEEIRRVDKDFHKWFTKYLLDLQELRVERNPIERLAGFMRGTLATSALGLNPKVFLTQAASLIAGRTYGLSLGKLTANYFRSVSGAKINGKRSIDVLMEYSPLMYERFTDGGNVEVGYLRKRGVISNIGAIASFTTHGINWHDTRVCNAIFLTALDHTASEFSVKYSPEHLKRAATMTEEIVYRTQANWTPIAKTEILRSQSVYSQLITMFMSEPLVMYSNLTTYWKTIRELKRILKQTDLTVEERTYYENLLKENRTEMGRTYTTIATQMMFLMLLGVLFRKFKRSRRDEEDEVKWTEMLLDEAVGELTGMFPIVRDIASFGFKYENASTQTVNDIKEVLESTYRAISEFNEAKTLDNAPALILNNTIKISTMLGLPLRNVNTYSRALLGLISDEGMYKYDDFFYQKQYKKDLQIAIDNNDKKLANTILGQVVKDDIVRSKMLELQFKGYDVFPNPIANAVSVNGEVVHLTITQKKDMQSIYNEYEKQARVLVSRYDFNMYDPLVQSRALNYIRNYYYLLAKEQVLGAKTSADKVKEVIKYLPLWQVMLIKAYVSTLETTDTMTKKQQVLAYINRQNLSYLQKEALLEFLGYKNDTKTTQKPTLNPFS